ncbi:TPA: hypothetical protein ACXDAY_002145 [Clostridium botulinum]|uniref:hypothetical protein n=1 Tax=Clostridium botulinum TaxID=1491 RepID=UPI0004645433|nr:hypothetical protein [Clostridium botulinum]APH20904.1 hypothetical protein NPD1_4225 [Clostridium botulinum]APQ71376.1 hypothetical protein RSJ8_4182 [Clostridium botulinum]APR02464.1 hypothetical protein RSJ2_4043 [Clostridium botulinum]AUN01563.1 hypothetical protein RSJ19_00850 [Clostridium botulinum]MBN3359281.1 hypothetical protein [Clostridium botulinum]
MNKYQKQLSKEIKRCSRILKEDYKTVRNHYIKKGKSKRLVLDKIKTNNISHLKQILKENFDIDINNNDNTYKPLNEVLKELSDKWNDYKN